ncbi:hypothetical protein COCC4DRAFT_38601 [Bipolaris maydis ATCC 48331]|uniref:Uncharacterized protein n=1 Tax=Cochliobolus heterostrophus (strain C4 / ATCC 48331 / race T) TaxID=665024 RepID=N4XPD2_COCH4|nr:uncharacterized protein COCC4DRAFT_38601 [Bipolaris maydis ATCC 48331]ENI06972.1 hypothetical protein COCC4DRAFT_38601 [Bipolaris maydis ATCC 48331]
MRGTAVFALASLVLPTFIAAVPVTGAASINVVTDVKRHAEPTENLVKRSLEAILPPRDAEVMVERSRGVGRPGSNSRNAEEGTAELVDRGRGMRPGQKRDADPTEDLIERGRGMRPGQKRDADPTEDLVERGRGMRPGQKRDAESTVELVERHRLVKPTKKRDAEGLVQRGRMVTPTKKRDVESLEDLAEEITV